jgi:predicted phosphate transport protein (TIGR00153 family)
LTLFKRTVGDERLFGLLEEAGGNVRRSTAMLRDLLSDWPEQAGLARDILKCEHEGDRITHDIIYRLHEDGVQAPFPTADMHALASALDDIVDYTEQTADQLGIYAVEAPMEQAQQLAEVLVGAGDAVAAALEALHGRSELIPHLVRINQLENEGDRLSRDAIASLFARGIDPMVVIRWKDIFESLEQAIDSCEKVAHVLEGISLRNGKRH